MHYIALMDCNNFFVSCERLFRPDLVQKPVAVLSSNDGVIVARSPEVKAMGVPMGLPLFQAKQLVDTSQITFFSSNFTLYRDISSRVMRVLRDEVGACEVYSIDEAFFALPADTTEAELLKLRQRIMQQTGIPVTIGAAATKTLAKVASEVGKRGSGAVLLTPEQWTLLAEELPASEVWNLGRATAAKLREYDVHSAAAFVRLDPTFVDRHFGIAGRRIQDELRGIRVHQLQQNADDIRQSIASTRSFAQVERERRVLESALSYHVVAVAEKLREKHLVAGTVTVELRASRHSDFALRPGAVQVPLELPSNETRVLLEAALRGLEQLYDPAVPYKKAGFVAGSVIPAAVLQHDLFSAAPARDTVLDAVTDRLNRRFGGGTLRPASILDNATRTSATLRSQSYTTVWKDIPTVRAD